MQLGLYRWCPGVLFLFSWAFSPVLAVEADPKPCPPRVDFKITDRPAVGLALGGGGTRGAAHVGVLKVLIAEGIPIDFVAGTSMGAVVGGLLAAGVDIEEIEQKFKGGSLMHAFFSVPPVIRVASTTVTSVPRAFGYKGYDGLYQGSGFRKYLNKAVPECSRSIENLGIPFAAVALNLLDGKSYAIDKGNLGLALEASCAIPVLRQPVAINDKLLVDGGVTNNLPVEQVKQMGANFVIAVDVDEQVELASEGDFRTVGSVAHRVITLHLSNVDKAQKQSADLIIHPRLNGIGLISTKAHDAQAAILAGEAAARQILPELKQKLGMQRNVVFRESSEDKVSTSD